VTSADTVLRLFDDTGIENLLETNDDSGASSSSLIISSVGAGTYYISVSKYAFLPEDGGTFSGSSSNPDFSYTLGVSFA
jgi:Bacterial pre-peptidase C-terminal domain